MTAERDSWEDLEPDFLYFLGSTSLRMHRSRGRSWGGGMGFFSPFLPLGLGLVRFLVVLVVVVVATLIEDPGYLNSWGSD